MQTAWRFGNYCNMVQIGLRTLSLLLIFCSSQHLSVLHFFSSPQTPFSVETVVEKALKQLNVNPLVIFTNATSFDDLIPYSTSTVVFDYTYSSSAASILRERSDLVITMRWEGSDLRDYVSAFADYIEKLNFTRVRLFADSEENWRIARYIGSGFSALFELPVFRVPQEWSSELLLKFIGRVVKPTGSNVFAFFTTANTTTSLLAAFEAKKLNKAGYAFIVSDEGRYVSSSDILLARHGLLYVAREESWAASSREDGEVAILSSMWSRLTTAASAWKSKFVLVNMQNSQPVLIAVNPASIPHNASFVFPGNSTIRPSSTSIVIPVSVNTEWINPDGVISPYSPWVMRGAVLAFQDANNHTSILPHFQFAVTSVALSGIEFNYNFTYQRVQLQAEQLGLLHIPPPFAINIAYTSNILRTMNLQIPQISPALSDSLSSPVQFPLYLRPQTSNRYYANVMAQVFKLFKWKRVAILYTPDQSSCEEFYRDFLHYGQFIGLNVTNDENKQRLPLTYNTDEGMTQALVCIQHIMQSSVRIIVVITQDIHLFLSALYDSGVRNEYLLIIQEGLSGSLLNGDAETFYKRRVVTHGALQFQPRAFIGKEGQRVLGILRALDGERMFPLGCQLFDSGMLYVHATDYMVTQGLDYENVTESMTAMRGTHFVGCSGLMSIDQNSNDKRDAQFSIINAIYFPNNDSSVVQDVIIYNPYSVTLISAVNSIQWPDNSTGIYLDTLVFNCPYRQTQFYPGLKVGIGVSVCFCVLTAIVAMSVWCTRWRNTYPYLNRQENISLEDEILLASVPLEMLQLAAMSTMSVTPLRYLGELLALDFDKVINAEGGTYWTLLNVVLGVMGGYVSLCVLKLAQLERKLEWLPLWSFLMLFYNLLLPAASSLLFLPLVSIPSKLYLCSLATDANFTSSYLSADCHQHCWQHAHLVYIVCYSAGLLIYIPLTLYTKPLWQEQQVSLHLRAQPLPLLIKSVVQVLLVLLCNIQFSDLMHELCYICVIAFYLFFGLCFPPFNYSR